MPQRWGRPAPRSACTCRRTHQRNWCQTASLRWRPRASPPHKCVYQRSKISLLCSVSAGVYTDQMRMQLQQKGHGGSEPSGGGATGAANGVGGMGRAAVWFSQACRKWAAVAARRPHVRQGCQARACAPHKLIRKGTSDETALSGSPGPGLVFGAVTAALGRNGAADSIRPLPGETRGHTQASSWYLRPCKARMEHEMLLRLRRLRQCGGNRRLVVQGGESGRRVAAAGGVVPKALGGRTCGKV